MLRHYLSLSLKVFARRKVFTAVSLFGISFTLVVLMLVTALLDHVIAPYPPEVNQDRTLGIYFAMEQGEHMRRNGGAGYELLDRYLRGVAGVETLSIVSYPSRAYSYLNGARIASYKKSTDAEFWRVMRFRFLEGAPYTPEDVANARMVAVINAATRQKFFGDGPVVGRTFEIDAQRFTVVGVVEDVPILRLVPFADVWVPTTTAKTDAYRRGITGNFMGLFMARTPADLPAIRAEVLSRVSRVEPSDPKAFDHVAAYPESLFDTAARVLTTGGDASVAEPGKRLWLALGVLATLFMLLPAINLVNLNVSRIMERASEIGVRKAFGASSRVLVGQFLVENVCLTLGGALVGFVGSAWLLWVLNGSGLILYADLQLNHRIFVYGLALAVAFGVVSGTYPAWRMSRLHPVQALKGASR